MRKKPRVLFVRPNESLVINEVAVIEAGTTDQGLHGKPGALPPISISVEKPATRDDRVDSAAPVPVPEDFVFDQSDEGTLMEPAAVCTSIAEHPADVRAARLLKD